MKKSKKLIEVFKIIENKDGSANIDLDIDESIYDSLFREGLRLSIPKNMRDKVVVVSPKFLDESQYSGKIRTVNMPDEEADAIVGFAIVEMFKKYIKDCEKGLK